MKYRSPLFGQSPTSDYEIIPRLVADDALDSTHQLRVPLETEDRVTPSVARWQWRVREWTAHVSYSNATDTDAFDVVLSDYYEIESDIVRPLGAVEPGDGYFCGWNRAWRESRNDTSVNPSVKSTSFKAHFCIGSTFDSYSIPNWPPPEDADLFWEYADFTFAPRLTARLEWVWFGDTVTTVISDGDYSEAASILVDGLLLPICSMSDDLFGSVAVYFQPTRFWTWDGRFDETTGARIIV